MALVFVLRPSHRHIDFMGAYHVSYHGRIKMKLWHILFLLGLVMIGVVFAGTLRGLPGISMLPQY